MSVHAKMLHPVVKYLPFGRTTNVKFDLSEWFFWGICMISQGAAACQLGNTSSHTITEFMQR